MQAINSTQKLMKKMRLIVLFDSVKDEIREISYIMDEDILDECKIKVQKKLDKKKKDKKKKDDLDGWKNVELVTARVNKNGMISLCCPYGKPQNPCCHLDDDLLTEQECRDINFLFGWFLKEPI